MESIARNSPKRRWRDYQTASGRRPVKEFISRLTDDEAAAVAAAMKDIRQNGHVNAHHLRGDIYEVIASSGNKAFRVLYATEGKQDGVPALASGESKWGEDRFHDRVDPQERAYP